MNYPKGTKHRRVEVARQVVSVPVAKRSKYGAVRTAVGSLTFDSKAEAKRFGELRLLEHTGEIVDLERQPEYRLHVQPDESDAADPVWIGVYRADFVYTTKAGEIVVEDVKGFATPLYRWKKKHVEAQYGIQIREIP